MTPVIEAESIPYEPAQLRGERLLVLAPHPDDEVIGCGGVVAQHLREGRRVRVVVATDGGDAATREEETRRGLARLGEAEVEFLGYPDRALDASIGEKLREILLDFRPDLILVPGPIEIHPDHLALARALCELVQRDETLFADLATARVAFYEVGQPLRPNALVDISDVAEAKYAAIAEHRSQLAQRDYAAYARGLNAYRAMTLAGATFAEGYYVVDLPSLRTIPFSELRMQSGAPRVLEVTREVLPISVVVRTKNRLALLAEAVASVRANGYPCEIVVVNDGGEQPQLDDVTLVHHEESRGRAEAGNSGVRAAKHPCIAFLDDDDLFYPEHLATLASAATQAPSHAAWYSDAVSAFLTISESGAYEARKRLRIYAHDFDRELLLVDNYIPLPALLVERETFLELGGFDPQFDLFEDWDFLIRLSARGHFLRVPKVTCEVRHFEGGSSVVLAAPEGSPRFREAKLRVWQKHAGGMDNSVIANVFERQKRRALELFAELVESKGQTERVRGDLDRLEREKSALVARAAETNDTINGYALRVRELEGALTELRPILTERQERALELERANEALRHAGTRHFERQARLEREMGELRHANHETHAELERARVEITRLNGLLDLIYRSRTWQLHKTIEKLRGRG